MMGTIPTRTDVCSKPLITVVAASAAKRTRSAGVINLNAARTARPNLMSFGPDIERVAHSAALIAADSPGTSRRP